MATREEFVLSNLPEPKVDAVGGFSRPKLTDERLQEIRRYADGSSDREVRNAIFELIAEVEEYRAN